MQAYLLTITNILKCLFCLGFFTSFGNFASSTRLEKNNFNNIRMNQHSFGVGSSFSNGAGGCSNMISNKEFNSLELIKQIDTWPYYQHDPEQYRVFVGDYYYFIVEGQKAPLGYTHKSFVEAMNWPSYWRIDHEKRFLVLSGTFSFNERSKAIQATLRQGHKDGRVQCLRKLGGELISVISPTGEHVLDMDLCGVDLFGIVTSGVHLTAYTWTEEGLKYWVPRRAMTKTPYPGMLDNSIATNLASGQKPLEKLVQRALEEASIPETYTRRHAKACGTVSYQMSRTNDGKLGCQHHVQYVYEMELAPEIVPKPSNGDVEKFRLMSLEEVIEALVRGEFNFRAMTWIAHFIRHGIVNAENEANLAEVCARLHRKHDLFII